MIPLQLSFNRRQTLNSTEASPSSSLAKEKAPLVFASSASRLIKTLDQGWLSGLSVPGKIQSAFLETAKEGPTALYVPEASVTAGRSLTAYKRGGWLEFQERLSEEVVVAALWLFGVKALQSLFQKKIEPGLFPRLPVSSDIAWKRPWGKPSTVDLHPQELFTAHSKEINTLLKLKALRWIFSVGTTLASVAYIVPKLNQWKTNQILAYLSRKDRSQDSSRRKRSEEGDNVQFGDPELQQQATKKNASSVVVTRSISGKIPPSVIIPGGTVTTTNYTATPTISFNAVTPNQTSQNGNFSAGSTYPVVSSTLQHSFKQQAFYPARLQNSTVVTQQQLFPSPQPLIPQRRTPQFGASPLSPIQGLGHLVEQTPWGSILVVDAGVATGRGYVASKRSKDETVEVLFRDLGSLYFYVLSTPHIMKGLSTLANKALGTYINIQPKMTVPIHQQIIDNLQGMHNTKDVTPELLKHMIQGESADILSYGQPLKQAMREADGRTFHNLLARELAVSLHHPALAEQMHEAVRQFHQDKPIQPEVIQQLIDGIQKRTIPLQQQLSSADEHHAVTALKNAFRHSVGVQIPLQHGMIDKVAVLEPVLSQLKSAESRTALSKRVQNLSRMDAMDRSHTMLRRCLNVARGFQPESFRENRTYETLADWMFEAFSNRMTLDEWMTGRLQKMDKGLKPFAKTLALEKPFSQMTLQELQHTSNQLGKQLQQPGLFLGRHTLKTLKKLHNQLKEVLEVFPPSTQTTLKNRFSDRIVTVAKDLEDKTTGVHQQLIKQYRQTLSAMQKGQMGHLFSLDIAAETPEQTQKLKELLQGGIRHDSRLVNQAMKTMGHLKNPNARLFDDGSKKRLYHNDIQRYCDSLTGLLENLPKNKSLMDSLKRYQTVSQNLHFMSWTLALGGTLIFIGSIIPKLQVELTKWRTGKNTNPGIASAMAQVNTPS